VDSSASLRWVGAGSRLVNGLFHSACVSLMYQKMDDVWPFWVMRGCWCDPTEVLALVRRRRWNVRTIAIGSVNLVRVARSASLIFVQR